MEYTNHCRKCGRVIYPGKLWCADCRAKVNEELEGKADRKWEYYFRWNLRHKK